MDNSELVNPYFVTDWWQNADLRHINARGHRDLANLIAHLVQEQACEVVEDDHTITDDMSEIEAVDQVLLRVLSEHMQTPPSYPLYEPKDFLAENLTMQQQSELIAQDQAFWDLQPKESRPWGPWRKPKNGNADPRTWEGVWPPEWKVASVPRVSRLLSQKIRLETDILRSLLA